MVNNNIESEFETSFNFHLGVFKNNLAQVDEYLNALNPLLRRTTEGTVHLFH